MRRIDYLVEQFIKAKGIKNPDMGSSEFIKDFVDYVADMKIKSKAYISFLYYLGFDFTEENTAEVGKGKDDTVVEPYDTNIITVDPEYMFSDIDLKRIIKGEMVVHESEPFLYNDYGFTRLPFYIKNYMTQNPYTQSEIKDFDDLHNSDNANIIVGVYGDVHDSDIKQKIRMLKMLKYKLDSNIIEDYGTYEDTYFYALGSDTQRVKVKVKERGYKKVESFLNSYAFDDSIRRSR